MHCGVCGRRMQGHWNHGRAYYRCKFTDDYPDANGSSTPARASTSRKSVVPGLDDWLGSLFDADNLDDTCAVLAGAPNPTPRTEPRRASSDAAIADCDASSPNYRPLLDDDDDAVTVAARWIADTHRERKPRELQLGEHIPDGELTARTVNGARRRPRRHRRRARRRRPGRQVRALRRTSGSPHLRTPWQESAGRGSASLVG